jgi:iron complex outermembrane recepter protein
MRLSLAVLLLPLTLASLGAQSPDSSRVLSPVRVTVTRDAPRSTLDLPFAVVRLTPDSLRPALRRLSVGELLFAVPGVSVGNRNNPSQDPRLGIRGFGARSAFGVRGVRVLRDGVPLTLPDGQTPIDWLDLESIGSLEVIRGTASALYGNAAGGVLALRTAPSDSGPARLTLRAFGDGNDITRFSGIASGRAGRGETDWLLAGTQLGGRGPRTYADQRYQSGFGRVGTRIGTTRIDLQASVFEMPIAENPGAVTAAELSTGRNLADSLSVVRRSRKDVSHRQVALSAERRQGGIEVGGTLFVGTRALDNPQPFAIVDVARRNWGGSLRGSASTTWSGLTLRSTAGVDWQGQRDDRRNFENCNARFGAVPLATCPTRDQERGAVRLNQRERLDAMGAFARWELEAPRRATVSVALRWDELRLTLQDRLITPTNADDSGDRALGAVTPMIGATVRLRPTLSWYANVSTAFETPTITELTNQPDGRAGLNASLDPQRTRMIESGLKGILGGRWQFDLSLYDATTRDELVPFDVPGQVGRRAFRNAGRTARRGAEFSLQGVSRFVEGGLALAHARYRYEDYALTTGTTTVQLAGRIIPGIPATTAQGWLTGRVRGWFATVEGTAQSRSALDDANTLNAPGWWVANIRLGRDAAPRRLGVEPLLGVDNLFARPYASALVVNATRGRFYEPAVPRTAYVGVRITGALNR